ncbi:MAG: PD-(D/E)XK nuclease family transposase [Lachnospiraceae bacterium]|nr:PD-(D/E)XK nuclease family transposase [Lachnospiraceae bacterium]
MNSGLKNFFPMIREKQDVLKRIHKNKKLKALFENWNKTQQEEFLNIVTGMKGVKILYDSFFKEIMNPEYNPERLEKFLTLLLGRKVKILRVLPNDSTRIADETSLLIMDIVVELEDGSIANIEVQKIGYYFPGQRSACYSADLLLRQYKRVRSEKQQTFHYKDIKNVYTIVFFEQSPTQFKDFPKLYRHFFEQKSDTGLELDLLQKYLFVPLDIFKKNLHNKGISSELDAWLTFLSVDEPSYIIELIEEYPEFKPMYEEIYQMCLNMEKVMEMFSQELQKLDQNTVQYMIDIMQDTIDEQKEQLDQKQQEITQGILNAINIMKELNVPENEILKKLQEKYLLTLEQAEEYLKH